MRDSIRRSLSTAREAAVSSNGWLRESVADYAPAEPFDLVFCHDVLQYLQDDRAAARAISAVVRPPTARSVSGIADPGVSAG